MIQQNASAAEEMAGMAEELSGQAEQLQSTVGFFRIRSDGSSGERKLLGYSGQAERSVHGKAPASVRRVNVAHAGSVFAHESEASGVPMDGASGRKSATGRIGRAGNPGDTSKSGSRAGKQADRPGAKGGVILDLSEGVGRDSLDAEFEEF